MSQQLYEKLDFNLEIMVDVDPERVSVNPNIEDKPDAKSNLDTKDHIWMQKVIQMQKTKSGCKW